MNKTFRKDYGALPSHLPLFPLPNCAVMPGSQLPLNVFEPRYVHLVLDALGADRMVGMVQSVPDQENSREAAPLFLTGTAGRISSFAETGDGRLLIALTGVCRFDIVEDTLTARGYRRALVDWTRFAVDYQDQQEPDEAERSMFFHLLRTFFEQKSLDGDWSLMERMPVPTLVNLLISQLPFEAAERQSLVNAITLDERMQLLRGLLAFDIASHGALGRSSRAH